MVIDSRTLKIYNDINEQSDILLKRLKEKGYEVSNDTAHGRVIYQLLWFKQEIKNERLKIPMTRDDRASISYIYTNGNISDIEDSDLILNRILSLTQNELILTPKHYPYLIEKIKKLITILEKSPRPLTKDESKILPELVEIIPKLESEDIIPYKDFTRVSYPGLWFIYSSWDGSTLDDIPKAGNLIKFIQEALVEGVYIEFTEVI